MKAKNLKGLFGKLSDYGDDALRLASNYGDEATEYLTPPLDVERYIPSKIDDAYVTSITYPYQVGHYDSFGVRDVIDNSWNANPTPEEFMNPGIDDLDIFSNPIVDYRFEAPVEFDPTLFADSKRFNDPNIYRDLADLDEFIAKTPPPDHNTIGWVTTPVDKSKQALRNLYDDLMLNQDISNPYNERIVSSYLDKLYPYSYDMENEVFKNKLLSKLPHREYGVFDSN